MEDQIWSARDRTVIARTKQNLEERKRLKVQVEYLESLLGPEDSDVDFRRILEEARHKKGCAIFETFSSDGPSEFLVSSRTRWDEHQRRLSAQREELRSVQPTWQQNSSSSASGRQWQASLEEQRVAWSSSERKVIAAVEDYVERCAGTKVDIEALERLMEPEEVEVCLRYVLKYATRRGSNIFQLFDTKEKKDHFVASRRLWLGAPRREGSLARKLAK